MRWHEIIGESASAGATGAGNIATVVGGRKGPKKGAIGAGFDPSGHKGIYDKAEKAKESVEADEMPLIRR